MQEPCTGVSDGASISSLELPLRALLGKRVKVAVTQRGQLRTRRPLFTSFFLSMFFLKRLESIFPFSFVFLSLSLSLSISLSLSHFLSISLSLSPSLSFFHILILVLSHLLSSPYFSLFSLSSSLLLSSLFLPSLPNSPFPSSFCPSPSPSLHPGDPAVWASLASSLPSLAFCVLQHPSLCLFLPNPLLFFCPFLSLSLSYPSFRSPLFLIPSSLLFPGFPSFPLSFSLSLSFPLLSLSLSTPCSAPFPFSFLPLPLPVPSPFSAPLTPSLLLPFLLFLPLPFFLFLSFLLHLPLPLSLAPPFPPHLPLQYPPLPSLSPTPVLAPPFPNLLLPLPLSLAPPFPPTPTSPISSPPLPLPHPSTRAPGSLISSSPFPSLSCSSFPPPPPLQRPPPPSFPPQYSRPRFPNLLAPSSGSIRPALHPRKISNIRK
ncbi:hypothetical protein C7M84_018200 [Penaeus vannamei]|uniref:Uncharacterized protein n=1 Tax=Penaeus vannamei TaxID=6689 RepID=A0A3R7QD92_PENVA|nr:hypothetical protein C7M84_018200 [Penaeus vannamei]